MTLPAIYRSEATILIEGQEVPEELVQTTVTGYIEERLQSITQVILNRQNLTSIIERYDLYADLRGKESAEKILETMRADISMLPIQTEVSDNRGRPSTATIAFKLGYEGQNPQKVLSTTETLVSLFLEENLRKRREKTKTATDFLESRLAALKSDVQDIESRIAGFKEEHIHSLPELMQLNLSTLDQIRKDMDSRREMLKSLMEQKIYLEGQLATIEPVRYVVTADGSRILTPEEEIKSLRSQYLTMKATKSEKHPDVVALKQRLNALESELSGSENVLDLQRQLRAKQDELERMQGKYTDKHPSLKQVQGEVAELQSRIAASGSRPKPQTSRPSQADNPAYINLQTQVRSTEIEIANSQKVLTDLQTKHDEYLRRVEMTPRVEQDYRALQRDYMNTQAKYEETLTKLMAAKEATALEQERVSERLTLINPPTLPEAPYKPNRMMLTLVTLFLAAGIGVAVGAVAEFLDNSIHDANDLNQLGGPQVLSALPCVYTARDRHQRLIRRISLACIALACLGLTLAVIHLFVMPVDIVIMKVLDKVGLSS